jgi:hypothetical protein
MKKVVQGCGVLLFIFVVSIPLMVMGSTRNAQQEMSDLNRTLYAVAQEFGYTPARHLYYTRGAYDISIVSGASRCSATLYFVTPLDVSAFKARLDTLAPRTMHDEWERFSTTVPWPSSDIRGLTLNGFSSEEARAAKLNGDNRYYEVPRYRRGSIRDALGVDVWLENTAILTGTLAINGQPIHGNIIQIRGNRGSYPFWVSCRSTSSHTPLSPLVP